MDALQVRRRTLPSWQAAAPDRVVPTTWPALGWVVLTVVATVLYELPVCTTAAPCTAEWGLTALELTTVVLPVAVWRLPRSAGPLALALVLAWGASLSFDAGLPRAVLAAAVLALAAWTVLAGRVVTAGDEAAAVLAAAAPQAVWPGPVPDALRRPSGLDGRRVALLLGVLGAVVVSYAAGTGAREAAQERAAQRLDGVVVAHDDDGYRLDVQVGDERLDVDTTSGNQDYPVGSRQVVLRTVDDLRLAAEPHDPTLLGGVGLLLLGLAAVSAARGRRRVRDLQALVTEPQPVLAVRVLPLGEAVVLAVDDHDGAGPALSAVPVAVLEPDGDDSDGEAWEDDEPVRPATQRATAYGLPLPGRAVALLTEDGTALLPLHLAGRPPALGGTLDDVPVDLDGPEAEVALQVLQPSRLRVELSRLGVLASLVACVGLAAVSDGLGGAVLRLLLVLNAGVGCLLTGFSQVRLDAAGVELVGPLRHRRVPWGGLAGVAVDRSDVVLVTRDDRPLPLPWPQSGFGLLKRPERDRRVRRAAAVLAGRMEQAVPAAPEVVVRSRPVAPLYAVAVVVSLLAGLLLRGTA